MSDCSVVYEGPGCTLRLALIATAAAYRLHCRTLRADALLADGSVIKARHYPFDQEIFALCEGDALALGSLLADARFTVLVTVGRDGDRAAIVLEQLGCTVVRGSSRHRGTEALRGLVHHLKSSTTPAAIVVDGPLGPAGVAKSGAVACAMLTGRPLHALAASASRSIVFPGTWSGLYMPLPFARVAIVCDSPLPLPEQSGLLDADHHTEELTRRFQKIRRHTQRGIICPPNGEVSVRLADPPRSSERTR